MYDISEKLDETLNNIPSMFGWNDEYIALLNNGVDRIWRAK
jgi:hypothetical protein